jgi:pseudouridine-5'-phosphate glycosidase
VTLFIRSEIEDAVAAGRPVVALESSLISHGLPRPVNLETARQLEEEIRREGALPATIGLLDGRLVVGLSGEEIRTLAEQHGVAKVSRRDLAPTLVEGGLGSTTVATTLFAAAAASIPLLATGGIGGVHRGAGRSFDISPDLPELSRCSAAVVCSGAKGFLDLPATLEVLETLGVPVVGFGSSELPAFYSRESGLALEHRVDTPADAARLLAVHRSLGLPGAIVFAHPPPADQALEREESQRLIAEALAAADRAGVRGQASTPFLLKHLAQASGGRTLETNVALLVANARLAARIAVAWAELPAARKRGESKLCP